MDNGRRAGSPHPVRSLLHEARLDEYTDRLMEAGYDDLQQLLGLNASGSQVADDVVAIFKMPIGHADRFKKEIANTIKCIETGPSSYASPVELAKAEQLLVPALAYREEEREHTSKESEHTSEEGYKPADDERTHDEQPYKRARREEIDNQTLLAGNARVREPMAATMEGNVLGSAVQPITAYPAAAQSILTQPVSNVSGPAAVAQPAAAKPGAAAATTDNANTSALGVVAPAAIAPSAGFATVSAAAQPQIAAAAMEPSASQRATQQRRMRQNESLAKEYDPPGWQDFLRDKGKKRENGDDELPEGWTSEMVPRNKRYIPQDAKKHSSHGSKDSDRCFFCPNNKKVSTLRNVWLVYGGFASTESEITKLNKVNARKVSNSSPPPGADGAPSSIGTLQEVD